VLARRPVRAAHCLTSVQWSPTGEHILLAYGRRHASLLTGTAATTPAATPNAADPPPITVLEIYDARTLARVFDFPSSVHEVNAAAFHPAPGCGLAFGTKDGAVCVLARRGE
jgi:activator-of-BECN1-regulated-autophagy protein 1